MNRVLISLAQVGVLILCFSYIQRIYSDNILPDKQAKAVFQQTECLLVSKKLVEGGQFFHAYRADFFINYTVNDVSYHNWVSGNGLDTSFRKNKDTQEAVLSEYIVGESYSCWYNPQNPNAVILVFRHNWMTTFPLVLPSIVFLIVGYYFLQNVFLFFGGSSRDSQATRYQGKKKK